MTTTAFRGQAAAAAVGTTRATAASVAATRPIRVMLVISNLEYGGAQRQVVEFANHVDPGHVEVHVCSLSSYTPLVKDLRLPPAQVHVIEKRAKFDVTVPARLAVLLRRLHIDVAHGYLFDAEIAVRLAGRLARTPLIVGSERNTEYTLKRIQLAVYRLTRNQVHVIIANSNAGARFNARTLGHPADQYRVVHNGVDASRFCPRDRTEARRRLGIDEDALVAGMIGSFKEQKNHPLLFAAARQVITRVPKLRLLLVGDELHAGMHGSREYRDRMHQLVDALGLRSHCIFLGNRDDVAAIYPACDVTVLPSLFEGTPNVALESMACGVPVVATDVSDNALVIPDGRVGFIVPLGSEDALANRLERLLTSGAEREAMGHAARQWIAQEFSTARLAEKTEAIYREWLHLRRTAS